VHLSRDGCKMADSVIRLHGDQEINRFSEIRVYSMELIRHETAPADDKKITEDIYEGK